MVVLLIGMILILTTINHWRQAHFGVLDYTHTMRLIIPGATLVALGFQTLLSSFFFSILGLKRK
jgi:hypothetical protein